RHPRRRARRRVRGARRAARRRRLGGAPARQAVRALDLGGRRAHGAGWLRHRRRPPLPRAAPGGPRMTPSPREGAARGGRTLLSVLVGGAFVALVFLLAWAVVRSDRPDREVLPSPLVGRPAPEFSLPVLHDDAYRVGSADLRGQPYLLNVWGSWCPGCQVEHPVLARYAESKRIRVVGFNWKDEPEDALRWLEQFGNPYWVVVADYEGKAA